MTKMTQFKRFFKSIFLILIIAFMFSIPSVIAEGIEDHESEIDPHGRSDEVIEYCKSSRDPDELKELYGAGLEYKGDNNFILSIDPASTTNSQLLNTIKSTEFKVVRVNNDKTDSPYIGQKVSYNHPLQMNIPTIPSDQIKDHDGESITGLLNYAVVVELESVDLVPTSLQSTVYDEEVVDCDAYVYFYLVYTSDGGPKISQSKVIKGLVDVDCSNLEGQSELIKNYCKANSISAENIVCGSNDIEDAAKFGEGTVAYNFCMVKRLAASNNYSDFLTNGKFDQTKKLPEFKCNPKNIREETSKNLEKPDDYYTEHQYFYGSSETTFPTDSKDYQYYQYEFLPGEIKNVGDPVTCKVKCEEAVAVEYGPPVASKAGLCFEYKVRVRSYVNCNMTQAPKLPVAYEICYPETACYSVHHPGVVYPQGGPDEDFHACVEKCDGGKYTPRCSQKCYKEVYGNSSTKVLTDSHGTLSYAKKLRSQGVAGQAAGKECLSPNGCYYRAQDGSITFRGKSWNSFATWYLYDYGTDEYLVLTPSLWCFNAYEGIPRRCSLDEEPGVRCYDPCYFEGCKGNYYLNPGYVEKDYERNLKIYNNVVSKCAAAASCTTSTADFKIAVDYSHKDDDGNIKKETIIYPFSTTEDKDSQGDILKSTNIENDKNKFKPNCFNEDGSPTDDKECVSTILDYNGCYRDANQKRWYLTEWSFPGTWISNKQHKISYKPVSGRGWTKVNKKFCLAQDALDVNQEWYNYYYKTQNNFLNNSSYSDSEIKSYCKNYGQQIKNVTITEESMNNVIYNIRAYAKKFGYYQWNIDIKCFYATNNLYSENTTEVTE